MSFTFLKVSCSAPGLRCLVYDCDNVVGVQGHLVADLIQGFVYLVNTTPMARPRKGKCGS